MYVIQGKNVFSQCVGFLWSWHFGCAMCECCFGSNHIAHPIIDVSISYEQWCWWRIYGINTLDTIYCQQDSIAYSVYSDNFLRNNNPISIQIILKKI